MWGDTPALGQRFFFQDHLRQVVGVVEDGKYHEMTESPQPAVYLPLSQNEERWPVFVVRSQRTPSEMTPVLERVLTSLVPDAQITVQSWPETIAGALFPARTATAAIGVMGLLAAMLAVTGIFGMATYNVSRRMKELGIRMALGARSRHLLGAAVGRPIALLGLGSLAGVFASRLLGEIVYQANPGDPMIIFGAILAMALLGIAASAIPALRALAIDPSKLLREV
jgi:ABC-type antimicrobial peptide transport system permease subunit